MPSTTRAVSRIPGLTSYDTASHRYRSEYLNPGLWRIEVEVLPDQDLPEINFAADPLTKDGRAGPLDKPIFIPAGKGFRHNTAAFYAEIAEVNGPFRRSVTQQVSSTAKTAIKNRDHRVLSKVSNPPWVFRISVPRLGEYRISSGYILESGSRVPSQNAPDLHLREFFIASIGDSYASGEGVPDLPGRPEDFDPDLSWYDYLNPTTLLYKLSAELIDWGWNRLKQEFTTLALAAEATIDMDPKPTWWEERAHRSTHSSHHRAARRLQRLGDGRMIKFVSFARSGATIPKGLIGPRDKHGRDAWVGSVGQCEELRRAAVGDRVDALVISIGGNDVGFAGNVRELLTGDNAFWKRGAPTNDDFARAAIESQFASVLAKLEGAFAQLVGSLAGININKVFLVEYPISHFYKRDPANPNNAEVPADGCGVFSSEFDLDITPKDAELFHRLGDQLNAELKRIAAIHGWEYITDVARYFMGNGYCRDEDKYFVGAEESLVTQGDLEGMLHPTHRGNEAIAKAISDALLEKVVRPREAMLAAAGAAGVAIPGGIAGAGAVRP